jgi:2-keto-4-pentenoate hydratase
MDAEGHAEAALHLQSAYAAHAPVEPLTDKFAGLAVGDAYEVQLLQVAAWVGAGSRVIGHKVGLTSRAMQRQLGVDRPDFGHLLDGMFHAEHQPIPEGTFLQPKVEPEIAFVLGRDLAGPGVTTARAAAAVDFVLPALEVIDSRIRDWAITIVDTIADNASSGGVVLGATPRRLADVDLRLSGCVLRLNGQVAATGAGGAVLGSPLASLVWLANMLGARGGGLADGQVVLPGSMTVAVSVDPGSVCSATMAGVGSVTACFAAGDEQ